MKQYSMWKRRKDFYSLMILILHCILSIIQKLANISILSRYFVNWNLFKFYCFILLKKNESKEHEYVSNDLLNKRLSYKSKLHLH